MSTEKISNQELVEELAAKLDITKRAAEDFVKTFWGTIEETLLSGDSVKIKDFGTFRPQLMDARKSVNVTTGEEMIIPGYTKVNFTPETSLKDLVNEPFAHLEAVALDEVENIGGDGGNMRHFSEQATEIKNIISDIEALSSKKENEPEQENEMKITLKTESEMKDENIENQPVQSENKAELTTNESLDDLFYEESSRKKRLWFIIILCILIAGGVVVFFACPELVEKLKFWDKQAPEEVVIKVEEIVEPVEINDLKVLFDTPRVYNEYLATVKLPEGSRLARLALLYYGHPYFWIYIYEANKDKIKNPNRVPAGMLIRVPKVNPQLIDANNPRCLEIAHEAEPMYLK